MVVTAVWGNYMPNQYQSPRFYDQFMDRYAKDISIEDWGLFKIIKFQLADKKYTSIGAFKNVYFIKS